ncbi:MAG: UvrB/UvrC motif-containing protein [Oscillospiraceae bacterium]|nr:UvrB/UvrC motif-containing protein [Oscillospiraceae bacterium]
MMCEKCNKNTANVYLKNSVNGLFAEAHLCSACAREALYGQNYTGLTGGDFKSQLFDAFGFGKPAAMTESAPKNNKCPMCGLSFADIAQSGKAGCGKCYAAFKGELEPSVTRIHGTSKHTGKIPENMSSRIFAKRKIEELGAKLKKTVAEQNFEEAAKLRDEINKIKSESEEKKA